MRRGNQRKFGRTNKIRDAFLRSLVVALVENGRISTTKARAKTLRGYVDKLVTIAKKQDITARRQLSAKFSPATVKVLVDKVAVNNKDRSGGYTRIIPMPRRRSDGSEMSIIEFVA